MVARSADIALSVEVTKPHSSSGRRMRRRIVRTIASVAHGCAERDPLAGDLGVVLIQPADMYQAPSDPHEDAGTEPRRADT